MISALDGNGRNDPDAPGPACSALIRPHRPEPRSTPIRDSSAAWQRCVLNRYFASEPDPLPDCTPLARRTPALSAVLGPPGLRPVPPTLGGGRCGRESNFSGLSILVRKSRVGRMWYGVMKAVLGVASDLAGRRASHPRAVAQGAGPPHRRRHGGLPDRRNDFCLMCEQFRECLTGAATFGSTPGRGDCEAPSPRWPASAVAAAPLT
jgi:hypothetical protein